tara:strand:- start:142 stop:408 length:267 start_codon:yes stop_codon:yes gene_type:complete
MGQHIVLPTPKHSVRLVFKILEQVGFVVVEQGPERTVPTDVRGPTRDKRHSALGTDRVGNMGLVKTCAFLGELVEIGRFDQWMAVAPE